MDIRVPVYHPHSRCECYTIVDTRHVEIVTGPDERGVADPARKGAATDARDEDWEVARLERLPEEGRP